jgi:hypothetical protein
MGGANTKARRRWIEKKHQELVDLQKVKPKLQPTSKKPLGRMQTMLYASASASLVAVLTLSLLLGSTLVFISSVVLLLILIATATFGTGRRKSGVHRSSLIEEKRGGGRIVRKASGNIRVRKIGGVRE